MTQNQTGGVPEALAEHLAGLLRAQPEGISEHQLLKQLADDFPLFRTDRSDPLQLFRQHFVLFHCLYQLQGHWRQQGFGELEIHTLNIQLQPWQGQKPGLTEDDPLRRYYLDLDNLDSTNREQVEDMLNAFWKGLNQPAQPGRWALEVLGFEQAPATGKELKSRYRQLALERHPDRGGDPEAQKALNDAFAELRPLYRDL